LDLSCATEKHPPFLARPHIESLYGGEGHEQSIETKGEGKRMDNEDQESDEETSDRRQKDILNTSPYCW
jgi:hypothetical protein